MQIPEKYDPVARVGKLFGLGPFGQKQLKCGSIYSALWIIFPLALNWHAWHIWFACLVMLVLAWFTYIDFFRFVFSESTWCYRCRKRKTVRREMTPKEVTVNGVWMCKRCYSGYSPLAKRFDEIGKKISGLFNMRNLFRGWVAPHGPLPDCPPEPDDKFDGPKP